MSLNPLDDNSYAAPFAAPSMDAESLRMMQKEPDNLYIALLCNISLPNPYLQRDRASRIQAMLQAADPSIRVYILENIQEEMLDRYDYYICLLDMLYDPDHKPALVKFPQMSPSLLSYFEADPIGMYWYGRLGGLDNCLGLLETVDERLPDYFTSVLTDNSNEGLVRSRDFLLRLISMQ